MRLLLIDDDELDRKSVIRSLKRSPLICDIVQANSAAEGLSLCTTEHFDVILLDYRLPDQNGLEVLSQLRGDDYAGIAVIMLSRMEDDLLAEQCLEAGAQDFLLKDEVSGRLLSRAVRQAKQRFLLEESLKKSREQLRQLSEHDPLTGLINRRGFEHALDAAMARVKRGRTRLAVLLLDLDDFKSVNDTMGHSAGDLLLIEIANRLSSTVRDTDLLCRMGGDEFVVLMTDFDQSEQAGLLAERIIAKFQEPILIGTNKRLVTTSIGIAQFDKDTENVSDLLKFADLAMYRAKQEGRNQVQFYSEKLEASALLRSGMKHDLYQALERGEFELYYQAQMNSTDGSLGGMEVLLRWWHPHYGMIPPATFIPIIEETGQIVEIGEWILSQACKQLKDWQLRFPEKTLELQVAVNLSAVQIRKDALIATIQNVLSKSLLEGHYLELEITESILIEDASQKIDLLTALLELGASFSLDDFGTGYSSLDYLRLYPISVLKIDKVFVSTIGEDAKGEKLLAAMIVFAKALAMKVVAEGIETKAQADFCAAQGCDLLQGFYFSRPVPAKEFEATFLRP